MAPHSYILVWRIRWTGEPGRLQSMGSQRVEDLVAKQEQGLSHHKGKVEQRGQRP